MFIFIKKILKTHYSDMPSWFGNIFEVMDWLHRQIWLVHVFFYFFSLCICSHLKFLRVSVNASALTVFCLCSRSCLKAIKNSKIKFFHPSFASDI